MRIFFSLKKKPQHRNTQNPERVKCAIPPRNASAFGTKPGDWVSLCSSCLQSGSSSAPLAASRQHVSVGGGPAPHLIRASRHHRGGALARPVLVTCQAARSIFSRLPGRLHRPLGVAPPRGRGLVYAKQLSRSQSRAGMQISRSPWPAGRGSLALPAQELVRGQDGCRGSLLAPLEHSQKENSSFRVENR